MSEENKEQNQEKATTPEETKEDSKASIPGEEGAEVKIPEKFKSIVESIEKMSVLDLNELVKLLEKKFGVSAAAVAVASSAGAGEAAGEEKTVFNLELKDAGAQKIGVIKVVKEVLVLGLKEAKDLVDSAPAMLKEGLKKEEAEEIKKKLEEAGAKVELK